MITDAARLPLRTQPDRYRGDSRHLHLSHLSNCRDVTARQVRVQAAQMLLEILPGFALGHVIRILLKITEPERAILPVNIPKTFHAVKVHLRPEVGNTGNV